ncbi:Chromosome (plasmid) partitioning protein ParB / Stage 0 sporulation protein J [Thioalkalivibrio nitratireducens DSM 14787]|uniref:Probable chromosome-partitioning protein ParB n=1 Tax=Thioalkalivibrio nitratireducens (strain DSM 14787 / UNIQEM 213 / ALEN2) TaxID=1255043 RepID=L0E3T3_THIND|nr:ParB/RepB/Spo0J family partition protein [Thioalkalivibrio nitratireducens]AGA35336.1 Chromosome (plasmid) partitioning protein ParB / Stage 0 sporulation protein J [Thioalkalivibrio nitratireducens DSM 14787]
MVKRRSGLGRGLEALLSGNESPEPDQDRLEHLPIEQVRRGRYQPRVHMATEALEELATSIRSQGIVQPIVVRRIGDGYELIAGERRWRAAQMAGLETIPAVVRDLPDQAAAAMALIENIQRENLNPLEEAEAIRRLIGEFEMTHQTAADAVGRSRTAVTNLLRLLELHDTVKDRVNRRELEMGHARCLLALPPERQPHAAELIVKRQLSVRDAERLVRRLLAEPATPAPAPRTLPEVRQLETRLSDTLGAAVQVRYNRAGKGRLVIEYNSLDELDGILAHIH